jgi:succinate dehydrogenase/fumarate reductase flavoprotein subunit
VSDPSPEQYRAWLRSSDDAYERAVRTATTLRERLEEMERVRERLVSQRDAIAEAARDLADALPTRPGLDLEIARDRVRDVLRSSL